MPTIRVLMIMIAVVSMLITTGCPPKDAVRNAAAASYRLPGVTDDLVNAVRVARDQNRISPETAADLGAKLETLAKAERVFVASVKAVTEAYADGQEIPAAKFAELKSFFDLQIVEGFLTVLKSINILSGDSVQIILLAAVLVRATIKSIGGSFKSKAAAKLPEVKGVENDGPGGMAGLWRVNTWQMYN